MGRKIVLLQGYVLFGGSEGGPLIVSDGRFTSLGNIRVGLGQKNVSHDNLRKAFKHDWYLTRKSGLSITRKILAELNITWLLSESGE